MRCVLSLLLLAPSAASAKQALEIETVDDEKYAEQVVAMADAEGAYVKIRFGISNVGPGDGKAGCEFQLIEKDGSILADEVLVDKEKWGYDNSKNTLSIGPCTATEGARLELKAPLKKGTVTIELLTKPTRRRVLDAKYGDDFYELDMLVPWAEAKVTIETGGKIRTLLGHGYADHPRSKIMPAKLAEKWFRFRALNGGDPRVVVIRMPKGETPIGWHESKKGRTDLDRVMLAPEGKKAWRARFKGKNGEWRVTTTELLHRSAPVEDRGAAIGSLIGAVVGNPVTYTFRGVLEERGSGAKIPGLVEVTITDE